MKKLPFILFLVLLSAVPVTLYIQAQTGPHPVKKAAVQKTAALQLRAGDIVFQTSSSVTAKAIETATHSRYSHCGIVQEKDGKLYVLEAVQPVRSIPLERWIAQGSNSAYAVKRLQKADSLLTPAVLQKMETVGSAWIGKNYDLGFEWSDETLYCSELVWKVYQRGAGIELAPTKKMKDFDLSSPLVQQQLALRFGKDVPLEEPVISPGALYESGLLESVSK